MKRGLEKREALKQGVELFEALVYIEVSVRPRIRGSSTYDEIWIRSSGT